MANFGDEMRAIKREQEFSERSKVVDINEENINNIIQDIKQTMISSVKKQVYTFQTTIILEKINYAKDVFEFRHHHIIYDEIIYRLKKDGLTVNRTSCSFSFTIEVSL